jgi:hypothetical protein
MKFIISFVSFLLLLLAGSVHSVPLTDAAPNGSIRSEKYPNGTIYTFSNGVELLELSNNVDPNLPALDIAHLLKLRKADPFAVLPEIPGVRPPKVNDASQYAPSYGAHECLTKGDSPSYWNSLTNGHNLANLGATWCCVTGTGYPFVASCTVMNTDGKAKASICKSQYEWSKLKVCVPCYHAGTAILKIVALCRKNDKVEGKIK